MRADLIKLAVCFPNFAKVPQNETPDMSTPWENENGWIQEDVGVTNDTRLNCARTRYALVTENVRQSRENEGYGEEKKHGEEHDQ